MLEQNEILVYEIDFFWLTLLKARPRNVLHDDSTWSNKSFIVGLVDGFGCLRYWQSSSYSSGGASSPKNCVHSCDKRLLIAPKLMIRASRRKGVVLRKGFRMIAAIKTGWSDSPHLRSRLSITAADTGLSIAAFFPMPRNLCTRDPNVSRTSSSRQNAACVMFAAIAKGARWCLILINGHKLAIYRHL